MNTMKSFVRQFIAVVKGDDAEATAQKALRQADSALQAQIASLKGDTIALEDAVTAAKENEELATVNSGKTITHREHYVKGLLDSKNAVILAEETLKNHKEKIAYLESKLAFLSAEVA
jgi:hypothetical protein